MELSQMMQKKSVKTRSVCKGQFRINQTLTNILSCDYHSNLAPKVSGYIVVIQMTLLVGNVCFYSVITNFRLELIELSARQLFIFWTQVEKEKSGGRVWRKENMSQTQRLETASELITVLTLNLYELKAKISGHALCTYLYINIYSTCSSCHKQVLKAPESLIFLIHRYLFSE